MYVFAKALADHGVEVCFIRDRADRYPFSQPVWEDIPFQMTYDEVSQAAFWPWEKWSEKERELKWTAPGWWYDPLDEPGGEALVAPSKRKGVLDRYFLRKYVRAPLRAPVLRKMRSCDALLVCGVEGSVLAYEAGRPFIIWPHGGDTMVAAGMFKPELYRLRFRVAHTLLRRQLVAAYANAVCIGSHEPTGICADYLGAEGFVRKQKIAFVPIPIPVRQRPSASDRRRMLHGLLTELGSSMPSGEYIGFVPSRIDFHWKGHDRLLQALARIKKESKASAVHLIFAGWGDDHGAAKRFVEENGLSGSVTLLGCALSKPLLYQFFLSADFVVDQFIMGMVGTSALEAISCGAPLITWLNNAYDRPWGAPPVLQARTADDIAVVLRDLSEGRLDLGGIGSSLQQWLGRVHDPAAVTRSLPAMFAGA